MKPQTEQPKQFIYLDEQGISSLYAQCVDAVEIERSVTSERSVSGKTSGKLGLKSILTTFLGAPETEINAELQGTQLRGTDIKTRFTVEQMLSKLIEYLRDQENTGFHESIDSAIRNIDDTNKELFICTVDKFDAPQLFIGDGIAIVNQSGALVFERNLNGNNHDYSDNYYKNIHKLVMIASLKKFPRLMGNISYASHESLYIRAYGGLSIPLGIFGSIRQLPKIYQIKPFALWMP